VAENRVRRRGAQASIGSAQRGRAGIATAIHQNADVSRAALKAFDHSVNSADAENLRDLPTLRGFSAALARDEPLASGAVETILAAVVATGLRVRPQIDGELLGLTEEQAVAWQQMAQRVWAAHRNRLDVESRRTWMELCDLALRSPLERGDLLVIFRYRQDVGDLLGTKLQMVEADRITNPNNQFDTATQRGGIDFDADGRPVAYNVANRHPNDWMRGTPLAWSRVPAFDPRGNPQALHLWFVRRPGESRGLPMFANTIEMFKQLGRFRDAEVMASVVNAMFAAFLQKPNATGATSFADEEEQIASGEVEEGEMAMDSGTMTDLLPGESVTFADPKRPNVAFEGFVRSVIEQVAVGVGMTYEVFVGHYTASYSAARAALLQAWKHFWRKREWLTERFVLPVYSRVIAEAVARGQLDAPGFFSDPLIRAAWLGAEVVGDPPGQIDELKEVQAARERVDGGFSTIAAETSGLTGGDWERNNEQRSREVRARNAAGLPPTQQSQGGGQPQPAQETLDSDLETPPMGAAA
jgi:lambda family phage portal protein